MIPLRPWNSQPAHVGSSAASNAVYETNEATRRDWRKLGFYYDRDDAAKQWRLVGSSMGLIGFAQALRKYASDPGHEKPSDHEHLGPYMYLEIGTWSEAVITDHWIAGPVQDLLRLSSELEDRIAKSRVGDRLEMGSTFAPDSPYGLVLEVREETFDPASADADCW